VTTPAEPQVAPHRIVVGVDGSESSKLALRWAARLIPVVGGSIEAVISWEYPSSYGWGPGVPTDWRPEIVAAKVLEQAFDEVFGPDRPADLTSTVREGRASFVLLDVSAGADLLVVGSRGHGGFAGLLLGSVSGACSEHATCPVLVVHGATPKA
jgi:nucleotide-binding universal stress UspA family protein